MDYRLKFGPAWLHSTFISHPSWWCMVTSPYLVPTRRQECSRKVAQQLSTADT